jgi:cytochrome c2
MRLNRAEALILSIALTGLGFGIGRFSSRNGRPGSAPPAAAEIWRPNPVARARRRWAMLAGAIAVSASGLGGYAAFVQASDAERLGHALTGGDPVRAPVLLRRYGCGGCHTISALSGADGKVAAPLDALAQRVFIAGAVRNSPDNLVRWIVSPQSLAPRSAMPTTGITPEEARDVAAFLYGH